MRSSRGWAFLSSVLHACDEQCVTSQQFGLHPRPRSCHRRRTSWMTWWSSSQQVPACWRLIITPHTAAHVDAVYVDRLAICVG
jgi:hypothetical protein